MSQSVVANPFAGNPLASRADLQQAVRALWDPVRQRLSPGLARARLGHTGADFPQVAAELEGFSRPLWGLVPLAAGGADVDWTPYHRGLAAGSDPAHEEYWGLAGSYDQRVVEMAAIGFALAMVPEQIWDPLGGRGRRDLGRWLGRVNEVETVDNNWLFFRVLVNEGLARVGAAGHDQAATRAALDRLESFYLGDGWYSDGPNTQRDYYVAFAMHFYGLLYARIAAHSDPARAERLRQRAADFAGDFAHWFADDGAGLPFGRSLTYRFAQGAFWGALAFAGVDALPWGQVKGLALRHIRWWARRPIFDNAGVLTIGYAYPNLTMAEEYNSPGSPYWAMKFFLPLALPQTHPFWASDEAPLSGVDDVRVQRHAGMVLHRERPGGQVFALATGQHAEGPRHRAQKYAKFAYSTAFGFCVPAGAHGLELGAHDSMLALSDEGELHWRVRDTVAESRLDGTVLYSRWQPWPDVTIETWLLPRPPWHVRVHRLHAGRPLWTAEGGYAVDRTGDDPQDPRGSSEAGPGYAFARYPAGSSGLVDLSGARAGQVIPLAPNTNLLHPRTALPTLRGTLAPGVHWLACAVLGATTQDTWTDVWHAPPTVAGIATELDLPAGSLEPSSPRRRARRTGAVRPTRRP